jgi:flagellar biosynthesis chaperone FliJ
MFEVERTRRHEMRQTITQIKNRIRDKENSISGWKMRIMQCEEDIWSINQRLQGFKPILKMHECDLIELKSLLANRKGLEGKK